MIVTRTIAETRAHRATLGTLALVPTMGALHEGHLSLVRIAKRLADHVAVSIFVNPTQFAPHEDFDRYPRPTESDLAKCEAEGVGLVFNPSVDELYPPDAPAVELSVPEVAQSLEGECRPHFFGGVCRVVAKLLNVVQPDVAVFGQKDYQQWRVIEAMTTGLCLPTRVEAGPTVRDDDGMALSSRNTYLDENQRKRGLSLSKALAEAERLVLEGEADPAEIESAMRRTMAAHNVKVDYAAVRHSKTLAALDLINLELEPVVCLVAGHVDHVRLIDNRVVGSDALV